MKLKFQMGPGAWDEINALHRQKFGTDPVRTGVNWEVPPEEIFQRILDSIERGEPYVEPPVPDGVDY
jgi:hypothetical protein